MQKIPHSLQEHKKHLRTEMRAKRRSLHDETPHAANALRDVFTVNLQLEEPAVIAAYLAFRGEIDPAPLMESLRAKGHKIALPVIVGKRMPLIFRLYENNDVLIPNDMDILQPAESAPLIEPDVLLIPLLAFDRARNRLGYGGGYYDRTIAGLRTHKQILTIGLAYASQEVAAVPTGENDIRLDHIATEVNVF